MLVCFVDVVGGCSVLCDGGAEGSVPRADSLELLQESLRQYAAYHPLRAKSHYQLRHTLEMYELWLKRPATVEDLTGTQVNPWLASLESRYSQRTVHSHRSNLLTLWRDCADRDLCQYPRRIRKVGKPEPKPEAWHLDEVANLVAAARSLPGVLKNGVPRAVYFEAFLRTAWETGLRRSDLWSLIRPDIRQGCLYVRQRKTGVVEAWELSQEVIDMLLAMPGPKPLAWPQSEWMFDYWFRVMKTVAEITNGKHAHGLRCSAATDLKRKGASAEEIQKFLGHKNLESQKNYVDKSVARTEKPKPTPLEKPTE